jgi:hypothetical protein
LSDYEIHTEDLGDLHPDFVGKRGGVITSYTGSSKNITLPNTFNSSPIIMVGDHAFGASGLDSVRIPSSYFFIGDFAFMANSSLSNVQLSQNLFYIGIGAFSLTALTDVTIPDSVKVIERLAFALCSNLTRITIGSDVVLGSIDEDDDEYYDAFDHGFDDYYTSNNKEAGTYTWNGSQWSFIPRSPSSGDSSLSSSSSDSDSSRPSFGFDSSFGTYIAGLNLNTISAGLALQLGPRLDLGNINLAVLGEGTAGAGYPALFEYRLGGIGMVSYKKIGLGFGGGIGGDYFIDFENSEKTEHRATAYLKMAFLWEYLSGTTMALYGAYYFSNVWGIGIQWNFR